MRAATTTFRERRSPTGWIWTPITQVANPNLRADYRPNPPEADVASTMFVTTNYVGAFAQDSDDNWTDGWTVSLNGNENSWKAVPDSPSADGACPAGTTADRHDQPAVRCRRRGDGLVPSGSTLRCRRTGGDADQRQHLRSGGRLSGHLHRQRGGGGRR